MTPLTLPLLLTVGLVVLNAGAGLLWLMSRREHVASPRRAAPARVARDSPVAAPVEAPPAPAPTPAEPPRPTAAAAGFDDLQELIDEQSGQDRAELSAAARAPRPQTGEIPPLEEIFCRYDDARRPPRHRPTGRPGRGNAGTRIDTTRPGADA